MSRILLTGASGFIGGHLLRRLRAEGHTVRALVREQSHTMQMLAPSVEQVGGDLTDRASLQRAVEGAEIVINCAAKVSDWGDPREFDRVNVGGALDLHSAASAVGARQFVHISTTDVYGFPDRVVAEDAPLRPTGSSYTNTKVLAEQRLREAQRSNGLPVTILRPSNVIGPGSKTYCIEILEAAFALRFIPDIARRDAAAGFLIVENLTDAICLTLGREVAFGEVYNVGDDSDLRWTDYLVRLTRMVGLNSPIIRLPKRGLYAAAFLLERVASLRGQNSRPPLTRLSVEILGTHQRFDISKIRRDLGFAPRVDFEQAIDSIHRWLHATGQFPTCLPPPANDPVPEAARENAARSLDLSPPQNVHAAAAGASH